MKSNIFPYIWKFSSWNSIEWENYEGKFCILWLEILQIYKIVIFVYSVLIYFRKLFQALKAFSWYILLTYWYSVGPFNWYSSLISIVEGPFQILNSDNLCIQKNSSVCMMSFSILFALTNLCKIIYVSWQTY